MVRTGWVAVLALSIVAAPLLAQQQGVPGEGGAPRVEFKKFTHSASCPKKCKTCEEAMAKGLAWLAKQQQGGAIQVGNGGTVVITCIAALAWMANGSTATSGPYSKNVVQAMQYVSRTVAPGAKNKGKTASGMEFEGFGNWDLGYAAIFLSEYYQQAPTPALKEKLEFLVEKMAEQREPNGGWGHAPNFAYKDLMVVTTACLGGLGSIKNLCGVPVPQEVFDKAAKYIEDSSSGGTVGYSPRPGQKGWGHSGRASGAAWALTKSGSGAKHLAQIAKFIKQDLTNAHKDHASPTLHYLWAGLWAYTAGPETWKTYKDMYLDWWLSAQQADGSFICPTKSDVEGTFGMDMDNKTVGPAYPTAVWCLVFALPYDHTNLPNAKSKTTASKRTTGLGLGKPKQDTPGWLGLYVKAFGDMGLEVRGLVKDGPAAKAGLAEGDVLVEINRKKLTDPASARDVLKSIKPGTKTKLVVLHLGEKTTVDVEVGEKAGEKPDLPDPDADPNAEPQPKPEGGTPSFDGEEI